jgi:hypothetical protein
MRGWARLVWAKRGTVWHHKASAVYSGLGGVLSLPVETPRLGMAGRGAARRH